MRYVHLFLASALLLLAVFIVGALAAPYLLGTAPPTPTLPMSADEANDVLAIIRFEQTASARHATVMPQPVYVVGIATPVPTATRPPRPTRTPFPLCPQPAGRVCEWAEPPPTPHPARTPTPFPTCATPVPGERCVTSQEE